MKIAVASGKGGTGKTFFATNFYKVLADRGESVTLTDCDAEAPNNLLFFNPVIKYSREISLKVPVINKEACIFCGRCSEWCHYNSIFYVPSAGIIEVIENLCHGCGACLVACEAGAITEKDVRLGTVTGCDHSQHCSIIEARMEVNEMSPVKVIKAAINDAGEDAIVILDSPPGTSCPFVQTVDTADYVILVTEPTPFGLSDLKQSVETLRLMGKTMGVIINRSDVGNNDVKRYLNDESITLLLELPYDAGIAHLYSEGRLAVDHKKELNEMLTTVIDKLIMEHGTGCNKR